MRAPIVAGNYCDAISVQERHEAEEKEREIFGFKISSRTLMTNPFAHRRVM